MKFRALVSLLFISSMTVLLYAGPDVGIAKPAPDFTLKNLDGKEVRLSDFKGKFVVLEWSSFDCPFVGKHYRSGNMQALQKKYTEKGVVWLAINSSGKGKAGSYPVDVLKEKFARNNFHALHYLLDEDGKVGKLYGAKVTPHMFVINPEGKLIYMGAIDSIRSANVADVKKAKNYVAAALDEAMAGKPVSEPVTQQYGCGIKY